MYDSMPVTNLVTPDHPLLKRTLEDKSRTIFPPGALVFIELIAERIRYRNEIDYTPLENGGAFKGPNSIGPHWVKIIETAQPTRHSLISPPGSLISPPCPGTCSSFSSLYY
jgi:hypothetical protein